MTVPAIRLSAVRKMFGPVQAVAGIDLEIGDGEFFAALGIGNRRSCRAGSASGWPWRGRW